MSYRYQLRVLRKTTGNGGNSADLSHGKRGTYKNVILSSPSQHELLKITTYYLGSWAKRNTQGIFIWKNYNWLNKAFLFFVF